MTKRLEVEGMSCGHCAAKVESLLSDIDGVQKISVDLDNDAVDIELEESKMNEILLKRIFNKNGTYIIK
jgi:copper chaperone